MSRMACNQCKIKLRLQISLPHYGIEINDLLYKLVTVSDSFIKVINDINYIDDNYQPYLNVTKLFITVV